MTTTTIITRRPRGRLGSDRGVGALLAQGRR